VIYGDGDELEQWEEERERERERERENRLLVGTGQEGPLRTSTVHPFAVP